MNQLSISSNDDYNVSVGTDNKYIGEVSSITDRDRRELSAAIGVELTDSVFGETVEDNLPELNFKAQKGCYSFLLNNMPLPGEKTEEKLGFDVIIDGVKTHYEDNAYLNGDYAPAVSVNVPFESKKYMLVDKTPDINVSGATFVSGKSELIDGETAVTCTGEGNYIELKSVTQKDCDVEQTADWETLKNSSSAVVEAEDYEAISGSGRLTQGISHMSGISKLNDIESSAKYTVTVPEPGYYDLCLRYSSWQEPVPRRNIEINGVIYTFDCPNTGGWGANPEDFKAIRIKSGVYLEAGEYSLTVGVASAGSVWNYDWISIIKSE